MNWPACMLDIDPPTRLHLAASMFSPSIESQASECCITKIIEELKILGGGILERNSL